MWTYCFKLAWLSIRKTPIMSALTVLTVAVGIACCLIMVTLYSVISNNPLEHKNDDIFALQLDSWGPDESFSDNNGLPTLLTFRDARALFEAGTAKHTVVTFRTGLNVSKDGSADPPKMELSRPTTNDFFAMFDVPFVYGAPWSDEVDKEGGRAAVISEGLNQRLFSGRNSLGESLFIEGEAFIIAGVVADAWRILPTVYDLQSNPFDKPPQVYVPLFSVQDIPYPTWSGRWAWQYEDITSHQDFLNSEVVWLLMWLGFENQEQKSQAEQYIYQYILGQKDRGRFQRPARFELSPPSQWLETYRIVKDDDRVLLWLSFGFLFVCLLNGAVLLLAKQLRRAPETGVRRALGASRRDIFIENITESLLIASLGSCVGLLLAYIGLQWVRALYTNYDAVAVLSAATLTGAVALTVATTLISGIIPAWKVSTTPAARYLKA